MRERGLPAQRGQAFFVDHGTDLPLATFTICRIIGSGSRHH
jgi:hypothetical protein